MVNKSRKMFMFSIKALNISVTTPHGDDDKTGLY